MKRLTLTPILYPDVVKVEEEYTVAFQVENTSFIPVAPVFCRLKRNEEIYWQFNYFSILKKVAVFRFELKAKEEGTEKLVVEVGFTPINLIVESEVEITVKEE